jgi:hypothetical protein
MPFITSEARHMTDTIGPREVGDRCFLFYREMLRKWRASPRWTTAHEIYRDTILFPPAGNMAVDATVDDTIDSLTAKELAWQVFFQLHVMPYEMQKRTMNGEIDY